MNKDELREKRNRTIESLNDIKAILGLDELYIDELEKELADAKKVQVVEHFEAYGQCRDSRRITELEQENADLKEQNRNLLESCEGATMMYKDLCKAKELLKMVLDWQCRCGNGHPTWQEVVAKTEDFLKGTEE